MLSFILDFTFIPSHEGHLVFAVSTHDVNVFSRVGYLAPEFTGWTSALKNPSWEPLALSHSLPPYKLTEGDRKVRFKVHKCKQLIVSLKKSLPSS